MLSSCVDEGMLWVITSIRDSLFENLTKWRQMDRLMSNALTGTASPLLADDT